MEFLIFTALLIAASLGGDSLLLLIKLTMSKKRKFKIEFVKQDKIKETAYQLIEDLFGLRLSGVFLSNESKLDDFLLDLDMDIPGHEFMSVSKVPIPERHKYKPPRLASDPNKFLVWYPPFTEKESEIIDKTTRKLLLKQVEDIYGISLEDYPENEPLYVWKVAELIVKQMI